jgi:hypothetical protein
MSDAEVTDMLGRASHSTAPASPAGTPP